MSHLYSCHTSKVESGELKYMFISGVSVLLRFVLPFFASIYIAINFEVYKNRSVLHVVAAKRSIMQQILFGIY